MSFIPDDDLVTDLLDNSDIEDDSRHVNITWDPDTFEIYPDFYPPDESQPIPATIDSNEQELKWEKTPFQSKSIDKKPPTAIEKAKTPMEYFSQYFSEDLFKKIAVNTKRVIISRGEHARYCDTDCIKKFFGVHILMGVVRFPQIKLYFNPKFKYHPISDALTYEKFRRLRISLTVSDKDRPDEIEIITNRLWKVQPVLEAVRSRCQQLSRDSIHYSIGEQIIHLVGPRLGTLNTWNRHGPSLKNFIATNPAGLIVDFEIFQGSFTDLPDRTFGTAAAIVLRLIKTLPDTCIYFGKNFTTVPLMTELSKQKVNATGLLMPSRWKKDLFEFTKDKLLKSGDSEEICKGSLCAIKWMDGKNALYVMSTAYGVKPSKNIEKFDQHSRQYIKIACPLALANYKRYILGTNLANQLMESYNTPFKSSKWPVNLILYLFDLAVSNSYLEYKADVGKTGAKFDVLDAAGFRLAIAEALIGGALAEVRTAHNDEDITDIAPEPTHSDTLMYRPASLDRIGHRFDGKDHWSVCDKSIKSQRSCRRERCRSRTNVMCSKCKVYLCFNYHKNCFYTFHNRLDKKPD